MLAPKPLSNKNFINKAKIAWHNFALKMAKKLAGGAFQMSPTDSVRLAGCVVFYYEQDGFKHFVTVRTLQDGIAGGIGRFPSFFGLLQGKDASETMKAAVHLQLGAAFFKKLDKNSLNMDKVAAVPTFSWLDSTLGTTNPVQLLVWATRITKQQADVITAMKGLQVRTIPEFAMNGHRISKAHKLIFRAVRRHIQTTDMQVFTTDQLLDQLDDMFEGFDSSRTLH